LAEKEKTGVLQKDGHSDQELQQILELRKVAVVGISRDPTKPSHYVTKYLKKHEYSIIPVNPFCEEVLGLRCYKSLLDVEESVDIVDVFRPSHKVPAVIDEALKKRPKVVWLQEGIHHSESERKALLSGIEVVWNRCMMKEHVRLYGGKPRVSLSSL